MTMGRSHIYSRSLLSLMTAALVTGGNVVSADEAAPKKPKMPTVTSLSVLPASLTLDNSRDSRSLIVTGKTAAGYSVDRSITSCPL